MLILSHGNLYSITYNVKNVDGSIKNLTGTQTLKYKLAKRVNSTPLIEFTLSDPELEISDPTNGVVTLTLSPTVLNSIKEGTHYHEIWQENALTEPTTLMREKLEIRTSLIKE